VDFIVFRESQPMASECARWECFVGCLMSGILRKDETRNLVHAGKVANVLLKTCKMIKFGRLRPLTMIRGAKGSV